MLRAPVPLWTPTYNMALSTAVMPCNYSGMFDPHVAARWGLVDVRRLVSTSGFPRSRCFLAMNSELTRWRSAPAVRLVQRQAALGERQASGQRAAAYEAGGECQGYRAANARLVRALSLRTHWPRSAAKRCPPWSRSIYRNLVKALPWFGTVREKLIDPEYSGALAGFDLTTSGSQRSPPFPQLSCL